MSGLELPPKIIVDQRGRKVKWWLIALILLGVLVMIGGVIWQQAGW